MTKIAPDAPPRSKSAAELKNEYNQIRKQADKDLKDLNRGRKKNGGFLAFFFYGSRST